MKKIIYLVSLFIIILSGSVKATHNIGYDMTLISLGNDLYKFRLVGYRDVTGVALNNSYKRIVVKRYKTSLYSVQM
jgi:hypothetical protein